MVRIRFGTPSFRSAGEPTAEIWFEADGPFPTAHWNDFALAILCELIHAIDASTSTRGPREVSLYEGDFTVIVHSRSPREGSIEFRDADQVVYAGEQDLANLRDQALRALQQLLALAPDDLKHSDVLKPYLAFCQGGS
ncbi:hypothetical protein LVB87_10025 [Lysobacter sp. KIS68-7]|uniref:hypothetical protein n=1 Tax=Lysobacter sp. KIS68-7 TaxID=2904252 RepID=UPI001E3A59F6|nr:hypothetical protein [Lysobacter sp. KIS68-7]UHQ18546.1 hypothetical protein LVB87_10025 [Lysobacter sp. KIS68-7]